MSNLRLFFSGDSYFRTLVRDLEQAKRSIVLESYIFNLDVVGLEVTHALAQAVKRGVQVRVLVDGVGSFNWLTHLLDLSREQGWSLRIYHPVPFQIALLRRLSWRNIRRLLALFRLNKRNHRKMILIDQRVVFLGSFNISQVHSERWMGQAAWRDTGVRVEDIEDSTDLQALGFAFRRSWVRSGRILNQGARELWQVLRRRPQLSDRFRLNTSPWQRIRVANDLIRRIRRAQNRVLITNAYFLPRARLVRALRQAAARGVHVALCLPARSDVWVVQEASRSQYLGLLQGGVQIFEYLPSMLHAKSTIIDQWASVGSHNMNHRSLIHDLELEMVITETSALQELETQWDQDLRQSRSLTIAELSATPWWRKILGKTLYLFRYWL